MSTDRAPSDPAKGLQHTLQRLHRTPWKFGFLALMRRFAATHAHLPPIGQAVRPQQEPFRLGQLAALTFAPREIAEIVMPDAAGASVGAVPQRRGNSASWPLIRLYGLGLLGPNGPLPLHYTEIVRDRTENQGDPTLANFLDLFHHRYLTHLYRAWAQSQAAAGLDRADDERFSRYVAHLTGHDPLEIRDSVLPSHARLSAASHLAREARNPDGLAHTLAHFFAVPVQIDEFVMHWIRIGDEDQSHLGQARSSSLMGIGAIAGEVVPDRQNKFRIVLGPLSLAQYLRFTPWGKDLPLLVEWVRGFIGYEFLWEVELRVRRDSAPPARLEDKERLGWSTWLGGADEDRQEVIGDGAPAVPADYSVGMVFEPEQYIQARSGAAGAAPGAKVAA